MFEEIKMVKTEKKRPFFLLLAIGLLLVAYGCTSVAPNQPAQIVYPTVMITQYVTQIVATVTPQGPAPTPAPPTPRPVNTGFDPYSVPIYYPLMFCPVASRLHVGDKAFVANGGDALGLHQSQDIGYAPIFRKLDPGEILDVIDGPYCQRLSLVWEVLTQDEQVGYVAEGDGNVYWLLPLGQLVEARKLKPTPYQAIRLGLPAKCRAR
jgi:hypothetical protein